jgi:hypothetical protein
LTLAHDPRVTVAHNQITSLRNELPSKSEPPVKA